ncbi:hypothetical protein K432DRAFT_447735 [Lepidopterella palustris CBS 459.81]|uniref:Uncharacterized protein n=1 Tax=Lepidopterella palustris CBS 459.81 TaxID=1314670 RepID=A0A8E2DXW1_9PEZI|nr:hypothetical protein K432DRAFT_447735 [Lepidopterella palustris CBS 459.81]
MSATTREDSSRGMDDLQELLQDMRRDINKMKSGKRKKSSREIKKKWNALVKHCPSLDIRIYTDLDVDVQSEDRTEEIIAKWKYNKDDMTPPPAKRVKHSAKWKRWNWLEICSKSADSNFGFRASHNYSLDIEPVEFFFSDRISSQLLYYRISVLFGMPPALETDGYKCCWEVELKHIDGESILRLYDSKGSAAVGFSGFDGSASDDAFELINFLVSLDCLHTYHGIKAGTRA